LFHVQILGLFLNLPKFIGSEIFYLPRLIKLDVTGAKFGVAAVWLLIQSQKANRTGEGSGGAP
jgi:hypothetical protein